MNKENKTKIWPIFFTSFLVIAGLTFIIFLSLKNSAKSIPKIKVSYFKNYSEFSEAIYKISSQNIKNEKIFWFGLEPERTDQVQFVQDLLLNFEKNNIEFDSVIIDEELTTAKDFAVQVKNYERVTLKDNIQTLVDYVNLNSNKKVLVITASIYSTNLIQSNPLQVFQEKTNVIPVTFSFSYFPVNTDDEKNNVFKCVTEDRTGTGPWGCAVISKARSIRRKINIGKLNLQPNQQQPPVILGLMDATGLKNYMILVR